MSKNFDSWRGLVKDTSGLWWASGARQTWSQRLTTAVVITGPSRASAWKRRTTGSPEVTTLAQVDLCIYSLLFANFQNSVSNYLPKISTKPPPSKQAGARVIGSLVFLACHALVRDSTYTWVMVKLSGAPWGSWAWMPFCLPFLISKTLAFRPSLSSKGQIGTIAN